jgi:hypothetical protein
MADELLGALACAWDTLRARHHEVPPVVLVSGSDSRHRLRSHAQPFGVDPLLAEGSQQPGRRPSPASALP